jgi:hypothetical protein
MPWCTCRLSSTGGSCTVPPTRWFFNAFALDYDSIPTASEPAEWLEFLRQLWEDDSESITCLQGWFGYLLTLDTRRLKFTMMVGPKRSVRLCAPLDPDQEPADQEPLTTANASAEPPF